MHYRELLLFLFKKLEHERSVNAVFHLLKGKNQLRHCKMHIFFKSKIFMVSIVN